MLANGLTQPYMNIFRQELSHHQRSGLQSNFGGFSLACKAAFCSEDCDYMSYKHIIKIKFKAFVFFSVFSILYHIVSSL